MYLYEEVGRLHFWERDLEVLDDLDATSLIDTDGFDARGIRHEIAELVEFPRIFTVLFCNLCIPSSCTLAMWQHAATRCSTASTRYLSSSTQYLSSSLSSRVPWFIDSSEPSLPKPTSSQKGTLHPLPLGIPVALQTLHAQLVQSPCLEHSKLLVRDPIPQPTGPPLPMSTPRGRRKRGGTYAGEGLLEPGDLWNWIVLAQVRS
jgi:hypothetical protein